MKAARPPGRMAPTHCDLMDAIELHRNLEDLQDKASTRNVVSHFMVVVPGSERVLHRALHIGCLGCLRHPQHTLYSPNDSANRSPDHGADGAGTAVTFVDAMSNTAGYPLRVRRERNRKCCNKRTCNQNVSFHQVDPLFDLGTTSLSANNGDWAARFCLKRGSAVFKKVRAPAHIGIACFNC
jgi:hypothetical protein